MAAMVRKAGKTTKLFQEVFGKQKERKTKIDTIKVNRPLINLGYPQGYG